MNALASAIPNPGLGALAFLNGTSVLNQGKAIQIGTPIAGGFADLINALFGSTAAGVVDTAISDRAPVLNAAAPKTSAQPQAAVAASVNVPSVTQDLTTQDLTPQDVAPQDLTPQDSASQLPAAATATPIPTLVTIVSDTKIAQAMIRSMLAAKPSSKVAVKAEDTKVDAKIDSPISLVPIATPVNIAAVPGPMLSKADQEAGDGFAQTLLKNPQVDIQISNNSQQPVAASSVPVAFAARLTPIQVTGTGETAGPVVAAPVVAEPVADATVVAAPMESDDALDETILPKPGILSGNVHAAADEGHAKPVTPIAMAAATSYSDGFSRGFENAQQQQAPAATVVAETKSATTFSTIANTMRASDSIAIANAQPLTTEHSQPVQSLTMRISRPEMSPVDLQISSRAGEIHVAVRTPDAALESSLRQDLGTLTSSLDRAGYRTETYVPRESTHEISFAAAAGQSGFSGFANSQENRQPSNGQSQQNFTGRDSHGSSSGNGRQQQQQQPNRDRRFQNWINEMEKQK